MKKAISLLLCSALFLSICGCASNDKPASGNNKEDPSSTADPVVFKLGHAAGDGQPFDNGLDLLAETVETKTEGRVKIQIFPSSTLGSETELRDMVKEGSTDMCAIGYTICSAWYTELYLPQMLFGFDTQDELMGIMKGEWGQKYFDEPMLADHGVRVLDQWPQAPRLLMSKDPVRTLEDLNGLKLRTPSGIPVREESWTNLGAMSLSLALADAFTSINQGVCDAVELPIDYLYSYHFNEQCKYLTETNHLIYSNTILINEESFNKISEADQAILLECVEQAGLAATEELSTVSEQYYAEFEADGVEIIKLSDEELAKFKDVIAPLYDKYMSEWGTEAYDDFVSSLDAIRG